MKSNLESDAGFGVEARPLFGVTPVVPWELQEQFASLRADVPGWLPRSTCADFHFPVLVSSLWQRLMAAVREPVRNLEVDGQRIVEVLGAARIQRRDDGTLSVQLRDLGSDGRLQWEDVPDDVVMLTGMPIGLPVARPDSQCRAGRDRAERRPARHPARRRRGRHVRARAVRALPPPAWFAMPICARCAARSPTR